MRETKQERIKRRTIAYLEATGSPKTVFARKVGIARESLYSWLKGYFNFGDIRLDKIDAFLRQFGF